MVKELRRSNLMISAITPIAGILLAARPKTSMKLLCYAVAAVFLILALTRTIAYYRLKKEHGLRSAGSLILSSAFNLVNQILIERADGRKRKETTVSFDLKDE